MLIKSNIQYTFHTNTTNKNIMATTIYTTRGKITIVTFYRPPRDNFLPLTDLQNFVNYNNHTLIVADCNIHHQIYGHSTTDKLGKIFNKFTIEKNLQFLGSHFNTYFHGTHKVKPDLIFCNNHFLHLATHIKEGERSIALDHIPIHLTFSSNSIAIPNQPKFNFNTADWSKFRDHMEELELPNLINKNTSEIDKQWVKISKHIMDGANKFIPKTNYKIIPAFTPSTRTKSLLYIYNQRHNLHKNNITEDIKNMFNPIWGGWYC